MGLLLLWSTVVRRNVGSVGAFTLSPPETRMGRLSFQGSSQRNTIHRALASDPNNEDCGCGPTVFEGRPSSDAIRDIVDHRDVIGSLPLYNVNGQKTSINDILGDAKENADKTSVVVFLRSLG